MADKSKLWYLENFNLFESIDQSNMEKLNNITSMQEI